MGDWWASLSATGQVYWFISIHFTIVLIIQLVLLLCCIIDKSKANSNLLQIELWKRKYKRD